MHQFHTSIEIHTPVERAWEVMADLRRWPEWTASISHVEPLDAQPAAAGSRFRVRQPGLPAAVWTVTRWEPPRGFVWESRAPGAHMVAEHWLEANASGCMLTLRLTCGGPVGRLVGSISRGTIERYLGLEAAGLKARAEGLR